MRANGQCHHGLSRSISGRDITAFLEPTWFDSLKAVEDAEPLIAAVSRARGVSKALAPDKKTLTEEIITRRARSPRSSSTT